MKFRETFKKLSKWEKIFYIFVAWAILSMISFTIYLFIQKRPVCTTTLLILMLCISNAISWFFRDMARLDNSKKENRPKLSKRTMLVQNIVLLVLGLTVIGLLVYGIIKNIGV